jgi:hypothetical protein
MTSSPLALHRESATYHEAGHMVVAAVLNLLIGRDGIHVDGCGQGYASYEPTESNGSSALEKERAIMSFLAGDLAKLRFYANCSTCHADMLLARNLLREIYPDEKSQSEAESRLRSEARALVEQFWPAIEAVATAVWNKPWTPVPEEEKGRNGFVSNDERCLDGFEILGILERFGIKARLSVS